MELQGDEALSLTPVKAEGKKDTLIVNTKEGRVELKDFQPG